VQAEADRAAAIAETASDELRRLKVANLGHDFAIEHLSGACG
jgi:hypothetical protein